MSKTRLNLSLDQDLVDFVKVFAAENRTSVADIVTQYFLALKRNTDREDVRTILSHPTFQRAISDVQTRLRDGTAEWYRFDDVFGD